MKTGTSKFKDITILYDDGGFAIAKGIWDDKNPAIGARWYEENGLGYPQTYGKPQWFIFPDDMGKLIELAVSFLKVIKNIV